MSALGVEFAKMSAGGNDFIVVEDSGEPGSAPDVADPAFIRRVCSRALSVGADGLIVVRRPAADAPRVRMIYFNADGGRAALCANGVRCVARLATLRGWAPAARLLIDTDSGTLEAGVEGGRAWLRLPLGLPAVRVLTLDAEGMEEPMQERIEATHLTAGVPHLVVLRPDAHAMDARLVARLGAALRRHPALGPDGANVDFVTVVDRHRLDLRSFERGVEAETLSCGTGCIAATLALRRAGLIEEEVECRFPSGMASGVRLEEGGRPPEGEVAAVYSGDARLIYTAVLHREAVEGFEA